MEPTPQRGDDQKCGLIIVLARSRRRAPASTARSRGHDGPRSTRRILRAPSNLDSNDRIAPVGSMTPPGSPSQESEGPLWTSLLSRRPSVTFQTGNLPRNGHGKICMGVATAGHATAAGDPSSGQRSRWRWILTTDRRSAFTAPVSACGEAPSHPMSHRGLDLRDRAARALRSEETAACASTAPRAHRPRGEPGACPGFNTSDPSDVFFPSPESDQTSTVQRNPPPRYKTTSTIRTTPTIPTPPPVPHLEYPSSHITI